MRNLLNFLAKYNHVIVFVFLESIALYLLFGVNDYHNIRFYKGLRSTTVGLEKQMSKVHNYFNLQEINDRLVEENTSLRDSLSLYKSLQTTASFSVDDSVSNRRFVYIPTKVINNSTNRQKNFITINKGQKNGIEKDMAVVSDNGIVGIVVATSPNYSIVMSLLNIDMRISAKIKSNGYFGSLTWEGEGYEFASLSEIPQHVQLHVGDSIVTSGYSSIFPEDVMIGVISNFESYGGDFYDITVKLSVDFKKLNNVYVVFNLGAVEQISLENSIND